MKSRTDLRADALAIWHAGLAAVRSDRLIRDNVRIDGDWLLIGNDDSVAGTLRVPLSPIRRIAVVGAGKAGAGMAAGLQQALGPQILTDKHVHGWFNVPADCVATNFGAETLDLGPSRIHLHPARPPGINEPTPEGVFGAEKILEIVSSLGPSDICFCLLSGGGSALMPAPVNGVSLAEKLAVTRLLSAGGANIEELNTVRKQLSRIKGGGLARACRAGRLITLIISDVLGDPLDVIASGPTIPDTRTPADALAILQRYNCASPTLTNFLTNSPTSTHHPLPCPTTNLIIGNNALAVDAAGIEAERRGYSHAMSAATTLEGPAENIGRHLAQMAVQMQSEPGPDCLITGGEPTVKLAPPEIRGRGGRNQQLVLAALIEYLTLTPSTSPSFALLSAGTDGEDGPTDAAGAILDAQTISRTRTLNLDPADYLRRNDAYTFSKPPTASSKPAPPTPTSATCG